MEPKRDDDKKTDLEDDKKGDCNKCKEDKCEDCTIDQKLDKHEDLKKVLPLPGKKLRRPRKNRKALHKQDHGQCFFPMSMSMLYGPLGDSTSEVTPPAFPYNVTFKQVCVFISASGVILFRAYNGKIFHDDTYGIFRHVYLYCEINYAIHCVMLYSVTYQLKCSSIIKL